MCSQTRTLSQRIEALTNAWLTGGKRALSRGDQAEATRCFEKARFWTSRMQVHSGRTQI